MKDPKPEQTTIKAQLAFFEITQSHSSTFRQLYTSKSMLLRICSGHKKMVDQAGAVTEAKSGDFAYLRQGERLTVENYVDEGGLYHAEGFTIEEAVLLENIKGKFNPSIDGKRRTGAMHEEFDRAFSNLKWVLATSNVSVRIIIHRFQELAIWMEESGAPFQAPNRHSLTKRLRDLLETDLEYNWRSENVAHVLGMSESTLRRTLGQEGTRFSKELRDAKLSCALALIQTTEQSLADIAYSSGFSSQSRLSEAFKARFSISPGKLRGATPK